MFRTHTASWIPMFLFVVARGGDGGTGANSVGDGGLAGRAGTGGLRRSGRRCDGGRTGTRCRTSDDGTAVGDVCKRHAMSWLGRTIALLGIVVSLVACGSADTGLIGGGTGGTGPVADSGNVLESCYRAGGICGCGCDMGWHLGPGFGEPGSLACGPSTPSGCAQVCCLPDPGGPAAGGSGGSVIFVTGGSREDASGHGAAGGTGGTISSDAATEASEFLGGPCGADTCTAGQICLDLTTMSGQQNPSAPSGPATQATKSCRTAPIVCNLSGPCDAVCCRALCGGGADARCSCGLTPTTGECTLSLP